MYNLRNLVMIGPSLNSVQLFTSDASQTHKTIVCCMSGGVWSMSGGVWRLSECQENPRSQHFLECRNGLLRNPGKFNFCRTPIGPTMKRLFDFLRV